MAGTGVKSFGDGIIATVPLLILDAEPRSTGRTSASVLRVLCWIDVCAYGHARFRSNPKSKNV